MLVHRWELEVEAELRNSQKPVRRRQNTTKIFCIFRLLFSFTEQGRLLRLVLEPDVWASLTAACTHFVKQSRLRWNFFRELFELRVRRSSIPRWHFNCEGAEPLPLCEFSFVHRLHICLFWLFFIHGGLTIYANESKLLLLASKWPKQSVWLALANMQPGSRFDSEIFHFSRMFVKVSPTFVSINTPLSSLVSVSWLCKHVFCPNKVN